MNKRRVGYSVLVVLVMMTVARVWAQFTMPPPAEPVDALPPSIHPLPPNTEPEPAAEECHISVNDIHFDSYTSDQGTDKADSMGMTVGCNAEVRLTVSASPSPDVANFDYRVMHHEGGDKATLRYQLYTSYTRNIIWGDGTGESQPIVRQVVPGITTIDVFGTIFANQKVPPGEYSDVVTVTLEAE